MELRFNIKKGPGSAALRNVTVRKRSFTQTKAAAKLDRRFEIFEILARTGIL